MQDRPLHDLQQFMDGVDAGIDRPKVLGLGMGCSCTCTTTASPLALSRRGCGSSPSCGIWQGMGLALLCSGHQGQLCSTALVRGRTSSPECDSWQGVGSALPYPHHQGQLRQTALLLSCPRAGSSVPMPLWPALLCCPGEGEACSPESCSWEGAETALLHPSCL